MDQKRIKNKLPVAREGLPFIIAGVALAIIMGVFHLILLALVISMITLFIVYFFRDPERSPVGDERAVLTPADGKILSIEKLDKGDHNFKHSSIKISIFMSIFNAHINRIPIRGKILDISYTPGKFFSANMDKASKFNEHNIITLETDDDKKIVFVQIAGLIARRIACWVKERDNVETGQRFGLIRFGSRLEVYLPANSEVTVQKGQKVKAGQTVIGYI
ncbi:MAG: phosphatidylserine decarboxylase family protein [Thermodesulfobacteriota bacterium]|nr:phosphatidylserine decarboxylase family protein [Thermodesulfobacteriota bacterium]